MGRSRETEPLVWTPDLAYAVGLIATDGCLITGKTTIDFTSHDRELVECFLSCIGRPSSYCSRVAAKEGQKFRAQIGDVRLYRWFQSLGLTPRKSLTIGALAIPDEHFAHFTRGALDGDGSIDCFVHNPVRKINADYRYLRLGVRFHSGSRAFVLWLSERLLALCGVRGALHVEPNKDPYGPLFVLKYGKYASIDLLTWLYRDSVARRLQRKFTIWDGYVRTERSGEFLYRRPSTRARVLRALDRAGGAH